MQSTITSKGQFTIPCAVRRHFGLTQGVTVTFEIEGDHIKLWPAQSFPQPAAPGFGLIRSRREGVPADFDAASLALQTP